MIKLRLRWLNRPGITFWIKSQLNYLLIYFLIAVSNSLTGSTTHPPQPSTHPPNHSSSHPPLQHMTFLFQLQTLQCKCSKFSTSNVMILLHIFTSWKYQTLIFIYKFDPQLKFNLNTIRRLNVRNWANLAYLFY